MNGAAVSETFTKKLGVSLMDEKDNMSLERGASNDITRLRWRLKIRENIIGRLVAENGRLRLTDAEREALEFAVETGCVATNDKATLRTLLERLGGEQ